MQLLINNDQIFESPDLFQKHTLDSIIFSGEQLCIFQGHENQSRERSIFYIRRAYQQSPNQLIDEQLFSKLRIYRIPEYQIIQEAFFETNLYDYLNSISQTSPLGEQKIKQIFESLFVHIRELERKQYLYGNISLNSIIFEKEVWKFDMAIGFLNLFKLNPIFYPFKQANERAQVYALGVVLFTCIFGFYPFTNRTPDIFKMKNYLEYLNQKNSQDCSKMVIFLRLKLQLSSDTVDILERSLSITKQFSLNDFINHPFFTNTQTKYRKLDVNSNLDIKILNELQPKEVSKVLVAMEKYKAQPIPVRRQNLLCSTSLRTMDNVINFLKTNQYLSRFHINENFKILQPIYYNQLSSENPLNSPPLLKLKYFNREINDLEDEYPCRQLIKYLDESRYSYGHDPDRQALLIRYGYPYAVAFELMKVQHKQAPQIQQKISAAVEMLLIVSNLNYIQTKPPIPQLHPLQFINQPFDVIKPKYRQILHSLYKHFLNTAIYKYNTAKKELLNNPDYQGANFLKQEGLNAYRLCWKLLEASLIIRKQGSDLDLGHIETSERKQIQIGINNLLAKYFPNKIY